MTATFRFAPSPTGPLHLGSARTAGLNWLAARQEGGRFLLRLEDTDAARGDVRFERDIITNLEWLGLSYNDGPPSPGFRQSQCLALYDEALGKLQTTGHVYGCDCSPDRLELVKKRQLSSGQPPRYDGRCVTLGLSLDPPHVVRFHVKDDAQAAWDDVLKGEQRFTDKALGDFVLRTSEGRVLFDLACLVDDARMEVTHVLRGEDHLTNTARHHLVLKALGLPVPVFGHLPLLREQSGAKLSKRALEGLGITALREAGYVSQAVLLYALDLGEGLIGDEVLPQAFAVDGALLPGVLPPWQQLCRGGGRVDLQHLDYFQRRVITHLPEAALRPQAMAVPAIHDRTADWPWDRLKEFWLCTPKLTELVEQLHALENGGALPEGLAVGQRAALEELLKDDAAWAAEDAFNAAVKAAAKNNALKPPQMFKPLRQLLAGRLGGPGLWLIVDALHPANARERLREALH